jgi:hypothetical protein
MRPCTAFLWLLLLTTSTAPADPSWWTAQGVKTTAPAANMAPATIGQAKHMAAMALAELETHLSAPAYQALYDDVAAIVDLTLPDPLPPGFYEQQRAVLLTGQLKAIAKPFYDHLRTHDAAWLDNAMTVDNLIVMEPGSNPPTPSPYPWSEATTDDANRAPATLGQLKAVFSLPLETLATTLPADTDGDGMSDEWEIAHGLDSNDPSDTDLDSDGDGFTNLQEYQMGLSPSSFEIIGPQNFGFDAELPEDFAADGPVLSFRNEHPSDLYPEASIPGWQAAIGNLIEIWDEGNGNPYVELQSHWSAHGLKQTFQMLPGTRLTFILRYKGRYDGWEISDNAFALKVKGASQLLVNGNPVGITGNVRSHSFMETDTGNQWEAWQHASISITAPQGTRGLMPITLSLEPNTTTYGSEEITHGGFVDLLPVEIVPDYNRDGMINDEDRGKATEQSPFYFWVNNDNDGELEGEYRDLPESNIDNVDQLVNARRDLIDFFPVQLRNKELLRIFPNGNYEHIIEHPEGAFNFIEMPDIQPNSDGGSSGFGAGSYLRNPVVEADAMQRSIQGLMKSTGDGGSELGIAFLDACENERGVLLFEATKATTVSIRYKIKKRSDGKEVAIVMRALPVSIAKNPASYQYLLDLAPAADGQAVADPTNPLDEKFRNSRKDRWFVMLHGYNVNPNQAKAMHSEVFKRLWHVGFDSRYVAVTWKGDVTQIGYKISPDYWRNVYNAFASSSPLAHKINQLTGASKSKTVIAAHSLGNMVVSSAICDHGLLAEQYYMTNSAVAKEAYVPAARDLEVNKMSHPSWRNTHAPLLWASNWYQLFNDGRNGLSWAGRFSTLNTMTTPINYYSSGEDIATDNDGSLPLEAARNGKRAWVAQEMFKGSILQDIIAGWNRGSWQSHGGWNIGGNPPDLNQGDADLRNQLKSQPYFDPFTVLGTLGGGAHPDPAGTAVTNAQAGSAHAAEYSVRAWLLAYEIPALSNPVASGKLPEINNIPYCECKDMNKNDVFNQNNIQWKHSAFYDEDFADVYKHYEDWQDKGKFRK